MIDSTTATTVRDAGRSRSTTQPLTATISGITAAITPAWLEVV